MLTIINDYDSATTSSMAYITLDFNSLFVGLSQDEDLLEYRIVYYIPWYLPLLMDSLAH